MKQILITIWLFVASTAFSQITVEGVVRDSATREPMPFCNVVLRQVGNQSILAFAITNDQGKFSLRYNGTADNLYLLASAVNARSEPVFIERINQTIDIFTTPKVLEIREVIVRAAPIERRSDTLSYLVENFLEPTDRAIADVLRRLPGIEVSESGQISFHGRPINRFYVEGLDMLGGRYGLATNNIPARDIAAVQIFENHQPIRALQDVQFSDQAAVNLILRESVRGTFASNAMLGVGYEPFMWTAELIGMLFSRNFQTLNIYKANSTGEDIARELTSLHEDHAFAPIRTPLNVIGNQSPPIATSRYLHNNAHMVTGNFINRLRDDSEVRANLSFLNDFQTSLGEAQTTYILSPDLTVFFDERNRQTVNINQANAEAQYMINNDRLFFRNILTLNTSWRNTSSELINDSDTINQRLSEQSVLLSNQLFSMITIGNYMFRLNSANRYEYLPSTLRVDPFLYANLSNGIRPAEQFFSARRFSSTSDISAGYIHRFRRGQFTHNYRLGYRYELYEMNSELRLMNDGLVMVLDSFQNAVRPSRTELFFSPDLSLAYNRLRINSSLPISWRQISMPHSISETPQRDVVFQPSLSISYPITAMLRLLANSSFQANDNAWHNSYPNYVMNNYRFISRRNSQFSDDRFWFNTISLNYGNAIRALFASASVSYWQRRSNQMHSLYFEDYFATFITHDIPNRSYGFGVNTRLSKRFESIRTTFVLNFHYNQTHGDIWRQDQIFSQENRSYNWVFGFNKRFTNFTMAYRANYGFSRNFSSANDMVLPTVHRLRQNAELNIFLAQSTSLRLLGEHYFNQAIENGSRHMYFFDVETIHRTSRFEFRLTLRNLLNARLYQTIWQSNLMEYRSLSNIRPRSILLSVRMSLN